MDFDGLKYNAKHLALAITITASAVTTYWRNDFRLVTIERNREEEAKEILIYREHQEEILKINKKYLEEKITYNDNKMIRQVTKVTVDFNEMLNEVKIDQLEQWNQINKNITK